MLARLHGVLFKLYLVLLRNERHIPNMVENLAEFFFFLKQVNQTLVSNCGDIDILRL